LKLLVDKKHPSLLEVKAHLNGEKFSVPLKPSNSSIIVSSNGLIKPQNANAEYGLPAVELIDTAPKK